MESDGGTRSGAGNVSRPKLIDSRQLHASRQVEIQLQRVIRIGRDDGLGRLHRLQVICQLFPPATVP